MKFKEVFSAAWKDYKENFWLYAKIMILFFIIPSLIFLGIETYFGIENPTIDTINISTVGYFSGKFLITFFFTVLYTVMILSSSLFNKRKLKDSFREGKKYYWKYIAFSIVIFIFLLVLYLLLIIPGIIFNVYWAFAGVILIAERKGIIESLKGSFNIVKGKWWKTLGYFILFFLIVLLINILISIIKWPTGIYIFIDVFRNPEFYKALENPTLVMQIHNYLSYFVILIQSFIITPLTILFTKSFFMAMKKGKK